MTVSSRPVRAFRTALAFAVWAFGAAHAMPLAILGPKGLASPDGFSVAVAEGELSAQNAELTAGQAKGRLRVFRVVPKQPGQPVTLTLKHEGKSSSRTFAVGPPAAKVSLRVDPPAPVKNRDTRATIYVDVVGPDGRADPDSAPPVLRVNVGKVQNLIRVGPGSYKGEYLLPDTRYPEVAIVVAFAAWPHPQSIYGSLGAVRVPLASAVDLPGQTEANADMSIVISGQRFGPVKAAADGRFKLPVVVPPGYGRGIGIAVDRLGNRRTAPIDLMLPPTDQLACVIAPNRLPADGHSKARVLCATSDPFGNAATGAKVVLTASKGQVSTPRNRDSGIQEWTFTAPSDFSDTSISLSASWRQGNVRGKEELALELAQGPVTVAKVEPSALVVHQGGALTLSVNASDALGRPRPGARLIADSAVGTLEPLPGGGGRASVWRWSLPGDASLGPLEAKFRVVGPAGTEPAQLSAGVSAIGPWVAVSDLAGWPAPNQRLRVGAREVVTGADGRAVLEPLAPGEHVFHHAIWPSLQTTLHVFENGEALDDGVGSAGPPAVVKVQVVPAAPVVVRLVAERSNLKYWAETIRGEPLPGRKLDVVLSQGLLGRVVERDGRFEAQVDGLSGAATVSVVDVETQVGAVSEVTP